MSIESPSEPGEESTEGSIHVHFDSKREYLTLNCSSAAFARVRELVLREASSAFADGGADRVSTIEIVDLSQFSHADRGWRDRIGLFGCALVCVVISLVLLAGVLQIVTWIVK